MFGITAETLGEGQYMTAAAAPCAELASMREKRGNAAAAAAYEYCRGTAEDAAMPLLPDGAGEPRRGGLSGITASELYGARIALSASRADKYYACPYMHFLYSGLRLEPRLTPEFNPSEAGNVTHYIVEKVLREIKDTVGFAGADENLCRELADRAAESYGRDVLSGLAGRDARFAYLFGRMKEDTARVTADMLGEINSSDFEPLEFELDMSALPASAELRGYIDRVDGWRSGDTLYLRVMDYKTGKKSFDLSSVMYGRDMQLLIYMFALPEHGEEKYGMKTSPAGVLYVPAADIILSLPQNTEDEKIAKDRDKQLRRSGLVLDDPEVIEAMERGAAKKYLPVSTRGKELSGDSLISAEQMGILKGHVESMLARAKTDILGGNIDCRPYYRNENDNACQYCAYLPVCAFDESAGDRRRFTKKLSAKDVWTGLGYSGN